MWNPGIAFDDIYSISWYNDVMIVLIPKSVQTFSESKWLILPRRMRKMSKSKHLMTTSASSAIHTWWTIICISFFMLFTVQWRNFNFINAFVTNFETVTIIKVQIHLLYLGTERFPCCSPVVNEKIDYCLFEFERPQFFCKIFRHYVFRASDGVRLICDFTSFFVFIIFN